MSVDQANKIKPPRQDLPAKKAETQRKFAGEHLLEPAGRTEVMRRADLTGRDLRSIQDAVRFSPFLEIGAGVGARSLLLCRDFGAEGAATDISQNSLRNMPFTAQILEVGDLPFCICCDAHYLPFLGDTFRFVFAYRTLHHTTNPIPVVAECYRVLGKGGHFFFNEEPLDSALRRFLRGRRRLNSPATPAQRLAAHLGMEKVFWDDGAWEQSAGITEARFERWLWLAALEPFEKVALTVNRKLKFHTNLRRPRFKTWLAGWIGGNVRGLCQKMSGKPAEGTFKNRLMCLDCSSTRLTPRLGRGFRCENCGRSYPEVDGITRMLPLEIEEAIYGEEGKSPIKRESG